MSLNELQSKHRALSLVPAVLVTLAFTAALPAAGSGLSLRDGVVVDTVRSLAYVMHPQGGIDAVDLERGAVVWHSSAGERPLALADDLLVAQGQPGEHGELRVVALDVRNGARGAEADLALAGGVRADVVETARQAFHVQALESPQGLLVVWTAQERPSLPERPAAKLAEAAPAGTAETAACRCGAGNLMGAALFDPHAGSLAALDAEAASQIGVRSTNIASRPPAPGERVVASADDRHLLTSRRTGDGTSPAPYTWTVSEAATGTVLGTVHSAVAVAPFVVVGTRLIHVGQPGTRRVRTQWTEQALRLRAVDLTTGNELWNREIRDPAYRGVMPH
jgi:hypothetical protein